MSSAHLILLSLTDVLFCIVWQTLCHHKHYNKFHQHTHKQRSGRANVVVHLRLAFQMKCDIWLKVWPRGSAKAKANTNTKNHSDSDTRNIIRIQSRLCCAALCCSLQTCSGQPTAVVVTQLFKWSRAATELNEPATLLKTIRFDSV